MSDLMPEGFWKVAAGMLVLNGLLVGGAVYLVVKVLQWTGVL